MSVIIDGTRYDVSIASLDIKSDILDSYAERTDDGRLNRGVIGTFYNYNVTFSPIKDPELHERFYDDLTAPLPSRMLTLPGVNTIHTFRGYITTDAVPLRRHKETGNTYGSIKARFIATEPARRP